MNVTPDEKLLVRCLPYLRAAARRAGMTMLVDGREKANSDELELLSLIKAVAARVEKSSAKGGA